MAAGDQYLFKRATEPYEFQQVYSLNFATFVNEIPQHPHNDDGILVDKFDHQNTYFICVKNGQVLGMVATRSRRPFSLDHKLGSIDQHFPDTSRFCEVRLLAVKPGQRLGYVFPGLMAMVATHLEDRYECAVISGNVKHVRLYRRMGFKDFGPLVGTAGAMYQPMYLSKQSYQKIFKPMLDALPIERSGDFYIMTEPVS